MNNAIITLSFDDARKDTYHVFRDILAPLDLKAVVYVPSGYVECVFLAKRDIDLLIVVKLSKFLPPRTYLYPNFL